MSMFGDALLGFAGGAAKGYADQTGAELAQEREIEGKRKLIQIANEMEAEKVALAETRRKQRMGEIRSSYEAKMKPGLIGQAQEDIEKASVMGPPGTADIIPKVSREQENLGLAQSATELGYTDEAKGFQSMGREDFERTKQEELAEGRKETRENTKAVKELELGQRKARDEANERYRAESIEQRRQAAEAAIRERRHATDSRYEAAMSGGGGKGKGGKKGDNEGPTQKDLDEVDGAFLSLAPMKKHLELKNKEGADVATIDTENSKHFLDILDRNRMFIAGDKINPSRAASAALEINNILLNPNPTERSQGIWNAINNGLIVFQPLGGKPYGGTEIGGELHAGLMVVNKQRAPLMFSPEVDAMLVDMFKAKPRSVNSWTTPAEKNVSAPSGLIGLEWRGGEPG